MATEIAVGLIINQENEFLVCQRNNKTYLPDLWELPGGKLKEGESLTETLQRELLEEINIKAINFSKLISTFFNYPSGLIVINGFLVKQWQGDIQAKEGQNLKWIKFDNFAKFKRKLLVASVPIINCYHFSNKFLITPAGKSLKFLINLLKKHQNLMVLYRDHDVNKSQYKANAKKLIKVANKQGHKILLTCDDAYEIGASGVHFNSKKLHSLKQKPKNLIVSASCHNVADINVANKLLIDLVFLSPIMATTSHPECDNFLTWYGFEQLCKLCSMPAYALGGVSEDDLITAKNIGGQGIAGISAFL